MRSVIRKICFMSVALALEACSRPAPSAITTDDARNLQATHLSGCLIHAQALVVRNSKIGEPGPVEFSAREIAGPAPLLLKQQNTSRTVEILDAGGAVLWSMGYAVSTQGPTVFRLPCVANAHSVRLNGYPGAEKVADAQLTARIEKL